HAELAEHFAHYDRCRSGATIFDLDGDPQLLAQHRGPVARLSSCLGEHAPVGSAHQVRIEAMITSYHFGVHQHRVADESGATALVTVQCLGSGKKREGTCE